MGNEHQRARLVGEGDAWEPAHGSVKPGKGHEAKRWNARRERREDRHAARDVRLQLEVTSCPLCGWDDYHVYSAIGWTCTWCRHVWSD